MRRTLTVGLLLLAAVVVGLPALLGRLTAHPAAARPPAVATVKTSVDSLISIKVFFPDKRLVQELSLGEYLKGVVAGEMPSDFETEALKAQMIVARTFAVRRIRQFGGSSATGCPLNPQADVCADPATGQAYVSQEQAVTKMGSATASAFWRRLDEVQKETDGLIVRYHGELIDPLYHSVSGTVTEDAGEYFSHAMPYLKPVDDHWGADAPKYADSVAFAPEELVRKLSSGGKDIALEVVASTTKSGHVPVQITARTTTGRVKSVTVGGTAFSGREFREKLGLRSTNFTVTAAQGSIMISTRGYGHGVGMSQYGANGMARAGEHYEEILKHYYQDVSIHPLFGE